MHLVELPNFTKASNLEHINLHSCERLCHLHPSILSIHTLVLLNLCGCKELKSLKGEIRLKSLKFVYLMGCSSLKEFSISSEELIHLDLCYSRLQRLPNELCFLTSLEYLALVGCKQLIELPHNIKALSRLKSLLLRKCQSLRSLPELPPSIRNVSATNCTSLGTILSLKAALNLDLMKISFKNCMRLGEHSLNDIMEDGHRPMVRAIIRNALNYPHPRHFVFCEVCYPGSKVPEWFRYQTRQASITVELDQPYHHLLGFLVCCVVSRAPSSSEWCHPVIKCQFRIGEGERDIYTSAWLCHQEGGWNSDHVFISYKTNACDRILGGIKMCGAYGTTYNLRISFEFFVSYSFHGSEPKFLVKGCGILPVYVSDILNFIQKVETESESDDKSKKYRDLDNLDLNSVKSEMILKMEERPAPQSRRKN